MTKYTNTMRLKKLHTRLFGSLLICCATLSDAETLYVTDELQLSLYKESDSQGELLQRLTSGAELELLELQGRYAKVRTKEGVVGWTKAGFLISEKPARLLLLDLQQQNNELQGELKKSQQQLEASRAEVKKIKDSHSNAYGELTKRLNQAEKIVATVDQLKQENTEYRIRLSSDQQKIPLNWGLIACTVTMVLGMLAGLALFDYRSRRRHGGYRIY